jgi:hypothetical protein
LECEFSWHQNRHKIPLTLPFAAFENSGILCSYRITSSAGNSREEEMPDNPGAVASVAQEFSANLRDLLAKADPADVSALFQLPSVAALTPTNNNNHNNNNHRAATAT